MKTIWKYQIDMTGEQRIDIPRGAQILTVQIQISLPYLWALVDPSEPSEVRVFQVRRTGETLADEPGLYVGTFQIYFASHAFHLFDVTPRANNS